MVIDYTSDQFNEIKVAADWIRIKMMSSSMVLPPYVKVIAACKQDNTRVVHPSPSTSHPFDTE